MNPLKSPAGSPAFSARLGSTMAFAGAAPPAPGTPEERSTEFVAVEGGTETTSAESLLVTAYFVMWAALLGFIFLTWRRQGKLETRLDGIHAELAKLAKKG